MNIFEESPNITALPFNKFHTFSESYINIFVNQLVHLLFLAQDYNIPFTDIYNTVSRLYALCSELTANDPQGTLEEHFSSLINYLHEINFPNEGGIKQ